MNKDTELISLEEAARRLGVSRTTLWRLLKRLGIKVMVDQTNSRSRVVEWRELSGKAMGRARVVVATSAGSAEFGVFRSGALGANEVAGPTFEIVDAEALAERYRLLKSRAIDTFSGNSLAVAELVSGQEGFAGAENGPFPIREWYPTLWWNVVAGGFVTTSATGIRSVWELTAGVRIADLTSLFPRMRSAYLALLAWVGLGEEQCRFVPFASYEASLSALRDGMVDIAYAIPVSQAAFATDKQVGGLVWLDLNPGATERDRQGAARHSLLFPGVSFRQNGGGVRSSLGFWGHWWQGNYFGSFVHADSDDDFVYSLARWRNESLRPESAVNPFVASNTIEQVRAALPEVLLPIHEGAIRYFRQCGIWTSENERRQEENLAMLGSYISAWDEALAEARESGVRVDDADPLWGLIWSRRRSSRAPLVASQVTI